jgi:hypothetical protein
MRLRRNGSSSERFEITPDDKVDSLDMGRIGLIQASLRDATRFVEMPVG